MLPASQQSIGFTLGRPDAGDFGLCVADNIEYLCTHDKQLVETSALKIRGKHNLANALAALALGQSIGLPVPAMLEALKQFPGLPHRTQWVADLNGVSWYNDSKGTNVGATLAAIEGLPGKHVLIAGGQGKGADFSLLAEAAKQRCRALVLIGEDADKIASAIEGAVPVEYADTMESAVKLAAGLAQKGDNVLLSPACASFDMYQGFEQRGETFIQAVRELQS
jgi:UDP-N-acetylmuramoylalanine--D-glutamate ligase